jgi:hypothetical protein
MILCMTEWIDAHKHPWASLIVDMLKEELQDDSERMSVYELLDGFEKNEAYEWMPLTTDDLPDGALEEIDNLEADFKDDEEVPDTYYRHALALYIYDVRLAALARRIIRKSKA